MPPIDPTIIAATARHTAAESIRRDSLRTGHLVAALKKDGIDVVQLSLADWTTIVDAFQGTMIAIAEEVERGA